MKQIKDAWVDETAPLPQPALPLYRSTNNNTKQRLTNNSFLKDPELTILDPKLYGAYFVLYF